MDFPLQSCRTVFRNRHAVLQRIDFGATIHRGQRSLAAHGQFAAPPVLCYKRRDSRNCSVTTESNSEETVECFGERITIGPIKRARRSQSITTTGQCGAPSLAVAVSGGCDVPILFIQKSLCNGAQNCTVFTIYSVGRFHGLCPCAITGPLPVKHHYFAVW